MQNKIVFEDKTILDNSIQGGVSYSIDINPSEDLQFGVSSSAQLTFIYYDSENDASELVGETFTYYNRQLSTDNWNKVGVFKVHDISAKKEWVTITSYDSVIDLDTDAYLYLETLTFPVVLKNLFSGVCTNCGLTYNAYNGTYKDLSIAKWDYPSTITARELLNTIAATCGCFIIADVDGKITMRDYTVNSTVIDNTKYTKKEDAIYTIDEVDLLHIQTSGTPIEYGSGFNEYRIEGNPIASQLTNLSTLYTKLNAITYTPSTMTLLQDYGVNVGDIINSNFYVMKKEVKSSGCVISCVGRKNRIYENKTVQAYSIDTNAIKDGAITEQKIENAAITSAKIRDAAITTAKIYDGAITNAKIGNAAIKTANIDDGQITSAKIGTGEIKNANIENGTITSAKIGNGEIKTANIDDLQVTSAKIANGAIDSAKIGDLDASKITTGNMAVGRMSANVISAINQNIGTAVIDGAVIEDGTITNAKIDDATITSAKIANGTITTANIQDASITNAKIDSINGNKIMNGSILAAALSQEVMSLLSGIKVYFQALEPENPNLGDLWYKTLVSNTDRVDALYIYTSGGWVAKTLDAQLLTAGTITALEIAANTITAANINMDNLQTNFQRIGNGNDFHIEIDNDSIDFKNNNTMLSSYTGNGVSIYNNNSQIGFFGLDTIREGVQLSGVSANNIIAKNEGAMVAIGGGYGNYKGYCFTARSNGHLTLKAL